MAESEESSQPLDHLAYQMAKRPIGLLGKVARAKEILQHYRLSQIARRVVNLAKKKAHPSRVVGSWRPSAAFDFRFTDQIHALAQIAIHHSHKHPSHSECELEKGKFVLLNHSIETDGKFPLSELENQTHLWRFQFHYHEFLLSQAATGNWPQIESFLSEWMLQFSPEQTRCSDDSWHPYCISRRLVVWLWLLSQSEQEAGVLRDELIGKLKVSLLHQAEHLSRNLEWDLGGNHLIENATALAITASIVKSKDAIRWKDLALRVLRGQLAEQILDHGEHFELSPMYHCQILSNFLRIVICNANEGEFCKLLDTPIEKMFGFLSAILHPDGEIPLLSDSNFQEAPSVRQIEEVAALDGRLLERRNVDRVDAVGHYYVLSSCDVHAICDFGQVAARSLPAHGHCDALNLEVSIEGHRWIVDSGNFNYSNDSMRHYCRSSVGHNVVTIDDQNQANVWSMFRMGRRPEVSNSRTGSQDGWNWVSASHNGYSRVGVSNLTRVIALQDSTIACCDIASISGEHKGENFVGYLHLHPSVELCDEESSDRRFVFSCSRGRVSRRLVVYADSATVERGWYCEEFGKRRVGAVIRYVTKLQMLGTGWLLGECENQVEIEFRKNGLGITMVPQLKFDWQLP